MIKVNKDWGINGNESGGYIVGRIKKNKKGEDMLTGIKYPSNLVNAIEYILKTEQKDLVVAKDMTLSEALEEFKKIQQKFTNILGATIKERV